MNKVIFIFLALIFSEASFAAVFGGSNLGFSGYPEPDCQKPQKPFKPYSFNNKYEVDSYNIEVDSYNFQRQQYIACVKEYIENSNNDIQRINESINEAIDKAKT